MRSGNSTVDLTPILLEDGHAIHLQPAISAPETLSARANVWDNQTLVLASNNPGADKTRLLVFITATVVDRQEIVFIQTRIIPVRSANRDSAAGHADSYPITVMSDAGRMIPVAVGFSAALNSCLRPDAAQCREA